MQSAETARGRKGNQVLFLALELGRREWKLGFGTAIGKRPRERTVLAGDVDAFEAEIARAKRRFGLRESAEVVSCYEAGRDGFWIFLDPSIPRVDGCAQPRGGLVEH